MNPSTVREDAAEDQRGRLCQAVECAEIGVWEYDYINDSVCLSSGYYTQLGYHVGEFPASFEATAALVHPDDLSHVRTILAEYRGGRRREHAFRLRMRRKDGTWAWILTRGRLVPGAHGKTAGTKIDISEQVRTEQELVALKNERDRPATGDSATGHGWAKSTEDDTRGLLGRAVDQCPVAILISDAQGRLEFANPCFYATTGHKPEDVRGHSLRFLKSGIHPPELYHEMWSTLTKGKDWRGELCNRRATGELYWVVATISPITNGAGRITHYVAVEKDVTHHKESLRAEMAMREQLEQSRRLAAVGKAVAGAAHCIRNVLSTMHGSLGMLDAALSNGHPENTEAARDLLHRSVFRLTQLTNDMVEHSRSRPPQPECTDVASMLLAIRQQLSASFGSRGIQFQAEIDSAELYWDFDRYLTERSLLNLGVNAAEAMPDGGTVVMRAYVSHGEGTQSLVCLPPPHLVLEVADNGVGIGTEDLPRVFDHFFTTKGSTGTGLGLANVREFMRIQGGDALVESRVARGSVFRLLLPKLGE